MILPSSLANCAMQAVKSGSISKTVARVRAAVGAAPLKMQVSGSGALLPPPPALSPTVPSSHFAQAAGASPDSRTSLERCASRGAPQIVMLRAGHGQYPARCGPLAGLCSLYHDPSIAVMWLHQRM